MARHCWYCNEADRMQAATSYLQCGHCGEYTTDAAGPSRPFIGTTATLAPKTRPASSAEVEAALNKQMLIFSPGRPVPMTDAPMVIAGRTRILDGVATQSSRASWGKWLVGVGVNVWIDDDDNVFEGTPPASVTPKRFWYGAHENPITENEAVLRAAGWDSCITEVPDDAA